MNKVRGNRLRPDRDSATEALKPPRNAALLAYGIIIWYSKDLQLTPVLPEGSWQQFEMSKDLEPLVQIELQILLRG
jgi:hypothetical protein